MDEKMAKGPSSQMLAPAIQSGIDRKLHRLTSPAHSGVSAPVKRPRNVEVEAEGQKPADTESGGLRLGDLRDQFRSPNQEILDQQGKDLRWKIIR